MLQSFYLDLMLYDIYEKNWGRLNCLCPPEFTRKAFVFLTFLKRNASELICFNFFMRN